MLPEARPIFADLAARGVAHRWAMSPRSSQPFALNLFAPLTPSGLREVFGLLGLDASEVQPVLFEYQDALDRLAGARPESPHARQVDVPSPGVSPLGERLVTLIEGKFTEIDFGHCRGYENPANPTRDVCRSAGLIAGDPHRCFQLANHGDGRRRYDCALGDITVRQPSGADDDGCLVRRSLSQPMRNLGSGRRQSTPSAPPRPTPPSGAGWRGSAPPSPTLLNAPYERSPQNSSSLSALMSGPPSPPTTVPEIHWTESPTS